MILFGTYLLWFLAWTGYSVRAVSISNEFLESTKAARSIEGNMKDPSVFVKEMKNELDVFLESNVDIFGKNMTLDEDNEVKFIDILTKFGKKLKTIATIASSFDINAIGNAEVKSSVLKLQHIGSIYRMGVDTMPLIKNIVALREIYTEDFMESVYDSDVTYSLKDFDDYLLRYAEIDRLKYYWHQMYDNNDMDIESLFHHIVELVQRNAEDFNESAAEFWYSTYSKDAKTQLSKITSIMDELKPFYELLHGIVRHNLIKKFGAGVIKANGPIPEHLYRQVWAQTWDDDNLFEDEFPYKQFPSNNPFIDDEEHNKRALETTEKFYQSMGYKYHAYDFSQENADTAEIYCPGDIDFSSSKILLRFCPQTNFDTYRKAHLLIGKVNNSFLPHDLRKHFLQGYLVDTVGQTVELAASSPKHLKKMGLFGELNVTSKMLLNHNFRSAVDFMFSLPYTYASVKVMTEILNESVKKEDLNRFYWHAMEDYAGIEPPVDRNEKSLDLPFSFYKDLNENTDLVEQFYSRVLAYRLYRGICQNIGHVGALHNCDFYDNKEGAELLGEILATGTSKKFEDILKLETIDASAILDYFDPVINWLKNVNITQVGWVPTTKRFTTTVITSEEDLKLFVDDASKQIFRLYDQINGELFVNEEDGDEFWRYSKTAAAAASELKEISWKAKELHLSGIKNTTAQKAVSKLVKAGDVFVLEEGMESLLYKKESLQNMSIDCDIRKYNHKTDEEFVAYYPDIENIYANSSDIEEMEYYWKEWRERNSLYSKDLLLGTIKSINKAADILEISVSDFWFKHFSSDFINEMENVIKNLKPFYAKLHYFVKQSLSVKYDDYYFNAGAIPDHLVEQVLLQIWTNSSIIEKDFPAEILPHTGQLLAEKNWDAMKLLHNADDFFHSLGFSNLDEDFWSKRVKAQSKIIEYGDCHATIYDRTATVYLRYCDKTDYRKLLQAYSSFGRVYYAKEKQELPAYDFDSYFLEYPVGEAVLLSASSPKYLQFLGLVKEEQFSPTVRLNHLMRMSIHTLFNIHKYFVNTKLISEYLEGEIDEDDITKRYWQLMIKYAGIEPPVDRKSTDFDFPYKFYTDLEQNHQMKKFFSDVLGYQIYEALCKLSGHEGDLNNCDFYGSIAAGNALRNMMQLGSSKPWKTVLKVLLGKRNELSAKALLTYYAPVEAWLEEAFDVTEGGEYSTSGRQYWRSEDII